MPDVNMASHEWRTEECEQFVRLFFNHPCLYNTTSKDYKDKNKGVFRLDATASIRQCYTRRAGFGTHSLPGIALSDASKLASTYFSLFYRSVHVL